MGNFVGIFHAIPEKKETCIPQDVEKEIFQSESFTFFYDRKSMETDQTTVYEDEQYFVYFFGECYGLEDIFSSVYHDDKMVAQMVCESFKLEGEAVFSKINGKFIVLIYDKSTEKLIAARDHFGVKPLFYIEKEQDIIFSTAKSDITALLTAEHVYAKALQHYFSFQFVPEPYTLHENVKMVDSATYFVKEQNKPMVFHKYWKPSFQPNNTSKDTFIKEIRERLYNSVVKRMDTSNRVGAFLSGGIDSTFITSIAKDINPTMKTFSVGFEREGFSEIDVAKETADKIGLENISKIITAEEYVEIIPEVIWNLEEPLADPSCIPLYYLSKVASEHIDIALSGEGADEIFAGYNIYREPTSLKTFQYIPKFMYPFIQFIANKMPNNMSGKSYLLRGTTPLQERYIGNAKIFEETDKASFLKAYDPNVTYQQLTKPYFDDVKDQPLEYQMQYVDLHTWMRGDILLKAGKMSQANQIEIRMPFVDHDVFNIANEIPINMKITNNTTKNILREAAVGIIPDHVLDRRKLGFPVPLRHWLSNELNGWAKQVIKESAVDEYINKQYVLNLLDMHTTGKADYSRKIWTFLIFMIWHQVFIEEKYDFGKEKKKERN